MRNKRYNDKYYNRHFVQYREWEKSIGKHIFETIRPSSILDLGCGVGSYLEGAFHAGCKDIKGVDLSYDMAKKYIVEDVAPYISEGDATCDLDINRKYDCVISFEVAEHIDPNGTEKFIENLTTLSNRYIVITAAPPWQRGTGHINLKEKKFWINTIEEKGFLFQDQLVELFWPIWKTFNTERYILKNLMVFKRK